MPDFITKPPSLFSHYKSLIEFLPTMAALTLPNGKLKHANSKMCDLLGFTLDEFRSMRSIYDISTSFINHKAKKIHTYCKRQESISGIIIKLTNKKGTNILAYLNFSIIRNADKHIAYYLFTFQEIPTLEMAAHHINHQDGKCHELENDINSILHFTNTPLLRHTRQIKELITDCLEQRKLTDEVLPMVQKLTESVEHHIERLAEVRADRHYLNPPVHVNVSNLIKEVIKSSLLPIQVQVVIDPNLPNFVTNTLALKQTFQAALQSLSAFPDPTLERFIHFLGMEIGDYYGFLIKAKGYQDINDIQIGIARKIIYSQGGKIHLSSPPRSDALCLMFTWPKVAV